MTVVNKPARPDWQLWTPVAGEVILDKSITGTYTMPEVYVGAWRSLLISATPTSTDVWYAVFTWRAVAGGANLGYPTEMVFGNGIASIEIVPVASAYLEITFYFGGTGSPVSYLYVHIAPSAIEHLRGPEIGGFSDMHMAGQVIPAGGNTVFNPQINMSGRKVFNANRSSLQIRWDIETMDLAGSWNVTNRIGWIGDANDVLSRTDELILPRQPWRLNVHNGDGAAGHYADIFVAGA